MRRLVKRPSTMIAAWVLGVVILGVGSESTVRAGGPVTATKISTPQKALRFEVTVPGSLDEVWAAFTTTDGLATWLWRDVRVDARPGGDWLAILAQGTAGGTIVSLTPKRQLVISALAPETYPAVRQERTQATFEFAAVTPTSTTVTLVQTGWKTGAEWDAAYEYLAGGNAELLTQLYERFVTGPVAWPNGR